MTKTFKDIQGIEEACWVGYKKVGMKKKGNKMVPNWIPEEAPTMNTGAIPNPAQTAMGPRIKSINVTDRRRKKDQVPTLLKRFRKYIEDTQW